MVFGFVRKEQCVHYLLFFLVDFVRLRDYNKNEGGR